MASRTVGAVARKIVSTPKAPAAIGPYSQAVVVDKTVYVSGQIGLDPSNGELVSQGAVEQTTQALQNMSAILDKAGTSLKNVVKTTVLLSDIGDYASVNEVYRKFFTEQYPARAAYQVAALPKGAKVEIEAIAVVGDSEDH